MGSAALLKGRSILVVEDDPLIRLELTSLFESVGAQVTATSTYEQAVAAIEQNQICAALLDHGLQEDNIAPLCRLLAERQIPYMFYTGYPDLEQNYPRAIIVQKPASAEVLLTRMADLIVGAPPNRVDRDAEMANDAFDSRMADQRLRRAQPEPEPEPHRSYDCQAALLEK
jgi:CheY-like chemotaxis protein